MHRRCGKLGCLLDPFTSTTSPVAATKRLWTVTSKKAAIFGRGAHAPGAHAGAAAKPPWQRRPCARPRKCTTRISDIAGSCARAGVHTRLSSGWPSSSMSPRIATRRPPWSGHWSGPTAPAPAVIEAGFSIKGVVDQGEAGLFDRNPAKIV